MKCGLRSQVAGVKSRHSGDMDVIIKKSSMAPQYELPERDNLEGEGFPLKTTKAFERGLEGLEMVAPRAGLEPATSRLTAGCSTN